MKGFKLVPVEPTDEMLQAAYVEMSSPSCCVFDEVAYRAMLAAAPAPQFPACASLIVGVGYVPLDWHNRFVDRVTTERDAAMSKISEIKESLAYRGSLLCRIEGQRDTLRAKLSRALELLRGTHTGDLFGPQDWATVDAFLAATTNYVDAALKPAEPAKDEHVCTGCGSKGWTANCAECVPY